MKCGVNNGRGEFSKVWEACSIESGQWSEEWTWGIKYGESSGERSMA